MNRDITEIQHLNDFAKEFSQELSFGDVVFLQGDLGAGKTTFTQLLLKHMGFEGRVKSPTYALYEIYNLEKFTLIHMDLYRIGDPQELYYLALDEIFDGQNIVVVEWPEKGLGVIPQASQSLYFELINSNKRLLKLDIT